MTALVVGSADAQMHPPPSHPVSPWPPSVAPSVNASPVTTRLEEQRPPQLSITPTSALPLARPTEPGLPLAPRGQAPDTGSGPSGALLTTAGSLALVLGLFFAAAWVLRRGNPQALSVLPGDVIEILGRAPLPGRHQMHLVRCGHKLLLVAISAAGADTLTEITDPVEVDRLCGLCREGHPQSATATFRNVLNTFGGDTATERATSASTKARAGRGARLAVSREDLDA